MLLFTLVAGLALGAEDLPTAEAILGRYTAALGGREACERVTTRVMKGTREFKDSGQAGQFDLYEKLPAKSLTVSEGESGVTRTATNGSIFWSLQPIDGFSERPAPRAPAVPPLHREARLREVFKDIAVKKKDKVGARAAWVLEGVNTGGTAVTLYFDVEPPSPRSRGATAGRRRRSPLS
jgi:hypothetical protein